MHPKSLIFFLILSFVCFSIYAGDPWADFFGTSSTAGTWNSGIRSDTTTSIHPPYVVRWERYAWAGTDVNVVPAISSTIIHNGYLFLGQGDSKNNWNAPGYIWAWDIATGVTKTGYPIGPLDGGGVISFSMAIANDNLYAMTANKVYGWDISGTPTLISGFPINITETTDGGVNVVYTEGGVVYYDNKLYFSTLINYSFPSAPLYLYVKNANNGTELFRKQLEGTGAHLPCIWGGRVYVAGFNSQKIYCWDANTGVPCSNFPVAVDGEMRSIPIIENGILYMGTGAWKFYAIDAVTGSILWTYNTQEGIFYAASIWQDKIFFGGNEGRLYGLYKATGMPVTGYPTNLALYIGHQIQVSTANGYVYANGAVVDANNGSNMWLNPSCCSGSSGGHSSAYGYPSTTIGQNEFVIVAGGLNAVVVYEMPSPTATVTINGTVTNTPSMTMTYTETPTYTITPTWTFTASPTTTPTPTGTASISLTPTASKTITTTNTQTPSASTTQTPTQSPTQTITPTRTPIPAEFCFELLGNYPNPFDKGTYIIFNLCKESDINIRIYTISGELVKEINKTCAPGKNDIYWNTVNRRSNSVASGVFIYVVEARSGNDKAVKYGKLVVVK